ncbi:hypothetical protein OGATHE_002311 [Ogataea polymorpha]|uniref:Uncharacterized protein n=1 Tax=Ogataea polymorpha TaxID=460523 RepID=A0A9P8TBJ6_9ASCO|nr:hypothetical protein OGATHE_002311 [Ogataea polymorpha]
MNFDPYWATLVMEPSGFLVTVRADSSTSNLKFFPFRNDGRLFDTSISTSSSPESCSGTSSTSAYGSSPPLSIRAVFLIPNALFICVSSQRSGSCFRFCPRGSTISVSRISTPLL